MPRKKTIPQKVDDILASFKIRSNDPQRFKDALVKLVRNNKIIISKGYKHEYKD